MKNWKSKREMFIEESTPYILCILGIICDAGFNIVSKVALDNGMSYYVLVAYGQAFKTVPTALLAFIFERFCLAYLLASLLFSNYRNSIS